jgi:hypothetical protein
MQIMGKKRPENAHVAWSRNLNYVRAKVLNHLQNSLIMPQEQKIEFVVPIERKFNPAAAQLNSRQGPVHYNFIRWPSVNQKKWNSALPREFRELLAGIRNPVNFPIGAWE